MKLDRTNQLLLLTVVVLSLVAGLQVWQSLRPATAFWTVDPIPTQSVLAVRIEGPGGSVRLERTDSSWTLTEPQRSPADKEKVEGLLRVWSEGFTPDLRLLKSGSEEQVLNFELDAEHRTRLLFEGPEKPLLEVDLGKRNPGGSRYLRPSGSREVFLGRVPGSSSLSTQPRDWADRRLFAFAEQDLASIVIRGPQGEFSFTQDEQGHWTSSDSQGFVPSAHRLDILGRTLAGLKARRTI
ncbi:MAG: DUF4340 domain-containing protein, partial [Myxococcota bacterium]|nr:DUF4340 domain-containing protein [Myxococcota bacterium]